jgi:S1-C subfamily serine protease
MHHRIAITLVATLLPLVAEGRGADLGALEARIAAATVTVLPATCAGVLVESPDLVVTAAHCVPGLANGVKVAFSDGVARRATVLVADHARDLAVLRLAHPVEAKPLRLATELPAEGDRLVFVGRVDEPPRVQTVRVVALDRCDSLPRVDSAIFTSLDAHKGDSGAPLVDAGLRVVGLVHGGARCHIAAPTASLGLDFARAREAATTEHAASGAQ